MPVCRVQDHCLRCLPHLNQLIDRASLGLKLFAQKMFHADSDEVFRIQHFKLGAGNAIWKQCS